MFDLLRGSSCGNTSVDIHIGRWRHVFWGPVSPLLPRFEEGFMSKEKCQVSSFVEILGYEELSWFDRPRQRWVDGLGVRCLGDSSKLVILCRSPKAIVGWLETGEARGWRNGESRKV